MEGDAFHCETWKGANEAPSRVACQMAECIFNGACGGRDADEEHARKANRPMAGARAQRDCGVGGERPVPGEPWRRLARTLETLLL